MLSLTKLFIGIILGAFVAAEQSDVEPACYARQWENTFPPSNIYVSSATWVRDNVYDVTLRYEAESLHLRSLGELKVIGLNSPVSGTKVVYSRNSKIYEINDPSSWSTTIRVNAKDSADGCHVEMYPFQIQVEWCQAGADTDECSSWPYPSVYDYDIGCDNMQDGVSRKHHAVYRWLKHSVSGCSAASTVAAISSQTTSSSQTSTSSQSSSSTAISSVTTQTTQTTTSGVPIWGQCGGNGHSGSTSCAEGVCVYVNDWYYQCQPGASTTTTSQASSSQVFSQLTTTEESISSEESIGLTSTVETTSSAEVVESTTSGNQAIPTIEFDVEIEFPAAEITEEETTETEEQVPLHGKCGGIGHTGSTTCANGICTYVNDWYYECLPREAESEEEVPLYGQCGGIN